MIGTFTPARRLEHPDLHAAFAPVGLKAPSRQAVYGDQLDALYGKSTASLIDDLKTTKFICVAVDGWKKRVVEQGAPLVTFNLLFPDGQQCSIFRRGPLEKITFLGPLPPASEASDRGPLEAPERGSGGPRG